MYKIALDRSIIDNFRDTVNDMPWLIYEDENDKKHWNTICACMDRITDIVDYLNNKELGDEQYRSNAFDFIDFIAQSSVLIDSIVTLAMTINGENYNIRVEIPHEIIFKNKKYASGFKPTKSKEYYDYRYYEYLRSICAMHPTSTNRHKEFQKYAKGEVSPFILWDKILCGLRNDNAELHAHVYANGEMQGTNALPIYIDEVFAYIKWNYFNLNYLSSQLAKKNKEKIKKFQNDKLPSREDCADYKDYMQYLINESKKRMPDLDYLFETSGHVVGLNITNENNLQKYKQFEKKVVRATEKTKIILQKMDFDAFEEGIPLKDLLFPDIDEEDTFKGACYFYSKTGYLTSSHGDIETARWATGGLQPFLSKYIDLKKEDCETLDRHELFALIHVALDLYWAEKRSKPKK